MDRKSEVYVSAVFLLADFKKSAIVLLCMHCNAQFISLLLVCQSIIQSIAFIVARLAPVQKHVFITFAASDR